MTVKHGNCQRIARRVSLEGSRERIGAPFAILRSYWQLPMCLVAAVLLYLVIPTAVATDTAMPKGLGQSKASQSVQGFVTVPLPESPDYLAPDDSEVRLLARGVGGSMAHFSLAPGRTSKAVAHRTVEELWYFLAGRGEMWRELNGQEEIVNLYPGVSISIPTGARFQFRSTGDEPLTAVAVTMPPWPGSDEAYQVPGKWP